MSPSSVHVADPAAGPARQIYAVASESEFADVRMSSDGTAVLLTAQTHSSSRMWLLSEDDRLIPLEPPSQPTGCAPTAGPIPPR